MNFIKKTIETVKKHLDASVLLKRMAHGAFWSLLAVLGNNFGNFLVGIILVHILGKFAYGQYGMLRSTISMFVLFSSFSIGVPATKYVAEFRDTDKDKTGRIIGLSLISVSVLGFIFFLGGYLGADYLAVHSLNSSEMAPFVRIGALMMLFAILNGVCIGVLNGFEAFPAVAVVNIAGALIFIAGSTLGAWQWELRGAVIALSVYLASMAVISLFLLIKKLNNVQIKIKFKNCMDEFPMLWKFSLPTTLGGFIMPSVLWFGNTILVKSPAGYDAMAVYDILGQWKIAALFFPNIIGRIALPMLSNLNVANDKADYFKMVKINLCFNGGAALAVALVLSLFSKLILSTYGAGFSAYVVPFVIIMAATVFSTMNTVVDQVILSKNKAWFSCVFYLLWSVVFLTFVYYFVYLQNYGVLGMTISFLISNIFHSVLQYCFLCYLVKRENK